MPLEYGASLPLERQLQVSAEGTRILLDILDVFHVKATFFSTVIFAKNNLTLLQRIVDAGHELASHSYYHSNFNTEDLALSKEALENICQIPVSGFRMPRMMPVDNAELKKAGYTYNSSINPVYVPGRYNNTHIPRTIFQADGLVQVPASATPLIRFPLFWLSFHLLPAWLFRGACSRTLNRDGYLNLYFHPWEFTDLSLPEFSLPGYLRYNTGAQMIKRFEALVRWLRSKGYDFATMHSFLSANGHLQVRS